MALTDNLRAYWKLDEAGGANNALDAHSTFTLTQYGSPGTGTGKINGARDLTSASDGFYDPSNNNFNPGDADFTIQVWVRADSLSGFPFILGKDNLSTQREYAFYYDSTASRFKFYVSATGSAVVEATANNFGAASTGTWYLLHGWHDSVNNLIGISVNAGTADTTSHSGGVFDSSSLFIIGEDNTAGLFWDGLIDEVAWWDRVLTSGERTSLYNGGAGLAYPLTVAGGTIRRTLPLLGVA